MRVVTVVDEAVKKAVPRTPVKPKARAASVMRKHAFGWLSTLLLATLVIFGLAGPAAVMAKSLFALESTATVSASALPTQGRDVLALIYQGGPFKYDKDGTVFGNRERLLPSKDRGYDREYTVKTPSERTRGARRIICGGIKPTAPDACYYTDDHYASFRKIVQ